MAYKIKNWERFQHFKNRRPLWIKLYRDLLDDEEWFALSGDDAKALIMLWLLASEDSTNTGTLPKTSSIAFRLRISSADVTARLSRLCQFVTQDDITAISRRYHGDITAISRRYHDGPPEIETETERETETEGECSSRPKARSPHKASSFKSWKSEDLASAATAANSDALLSGAELSDFIAYWSEPMASGRIRATAEKAFDVRRRMQTWRRITDERAARSPAAPRQQQHGPRDFTDAELAARQRAQAQDFVISLARSSERQLSAAQLAKARSHLCAGQSPAMSAAASAGISDALKSAEYMALPKSAVFENP